MSRHGMLQFLSRFNLVVLLGAVPLRAIGGKSGIMLWRGSVFETSNGKYLATLHPAFIMRQQEMFPIVVADLSKIHQEGWTREYLPPERKHNLSADESHLRTYGRQPFAFDVETTSLTPSPGSVSILGLSQDIGQADVFGDVQELRGALQDVFGSDVVKVGHNVYFDISHLEAQGIKVKGPFFDTLVAHHLILSDTPNDLGFVASLYTRMPYWKDQAKTDLEAYNAQDVDATYQIYDTLEPEIRAKGLQRVFDTSMSVLPILQRMEQRGIAVNQILQRRWYVALERQIKSKEIDLGILTQDKTFNWQSPTQVANLLYGKLKLPSYRNKKGGVTTDEKALESLVDLTQNKVAKAILELRKLRKLSSTYFAHPEAPDGRIHSRFLLHGTATGRLSSREPNLQNVPKGPARGIYIPSPGMVFVSADYNQIELRVAAILAQEDALIHAFSTGADIHRTVASEVYHVRPSDVTELQRFRAKFIVYGLGYGRGAQSIAKEHKMPVTEARRFIDEYFLKFPNIKRWRDSQPTLARSQGYIANPFGRRRYFFTDQLVTQAYNFQPQSTAADILLEAMVRLDAQLPKGAFLLLQVHDQLVVECPEEMEAEVVHCMQDVMQESVDCLFGHRFPVKVKTGHTWQECD